jgi:Tol biopolymer transport system component
MNTSKEGATVNRVSVGVLAVILAAVGLWPGTKEAWAQTGPVIVWNDGYAVMVDYGDGAVPTVLTGGDYPSLSPDRRWVVFSRDDGLYTIGVDGLELRKVLDNAAFDEFLGWQSYNGASWPVWTPDGRSLLFSWWNAYVSDLALVGVDGSNPRLLTDTRMGPTPANQSWPSAFSPDGRRLLVYASSEGPGLAVRDLEDGSERGLTRRWCESGSWSPDGLWVAFVWQSDDTEIGLAVVSLDGAATHELADPVRSVMSQPFEPDVLGLVTWSPDGKEVAVRNRADGLLYAVAVDGSGVRQVAWHFAPFTYPASAVERAPHGARQSRASGRSWAAGLGPDQDRGSIAGRIIRPSDGQIAASRAPIAGPPPSGQGEVSSKPHCRAQGEGEVPGCRL